MVDLATHYCEELLEVDGFHRGVCACAYSTPPVPGVDLVVDDLMAHAAAMEAKAAAAPIAWTDQPRIRALLTVDESEAVHILTAPAASPSQLEAHGVDVPKGLVDSQAARYSEWEEHQRQVESWLETLTPDDELDAERIRSVILHQARTWAEYRAYATCDHKVAVALLEAGNTPSRCAVCGSRVSWRHRIDPETGNMEPTGELYVL